MTEAQPLTFDCTHTGITPEKRAERTRQLAAWVRETLLYLGPLFIKLGQYVQWLHVVLQLQAPVHRTGCFQPGRICSRPNSLESFRSYRCDVGVVRLAFCTT